MLLCRQMTLSPLTGGWMAVLFIRLPLHQVVVAGNFIDCRFQSDF